MKILAIRIKNLASLEGDTTIDFTAMPLHSAGIFAITGPTGAGKSTILDALCLALYAKTPRYLQAKEANIDVQDPGGSSISQGDIRGILRDGTAEGAAEVDFVAVDGQHYRATWHIRRASNKAQGRLQAYTVALKNLSTNTDIPGKKTELLPEIERLVGLNFEQFTRSVLLAQGDFTSFLKAPKDEKSSLLEKLTGTQIYSAISQRIFEKHRNEALELSNLNIQRQGIITLTGEELDDYNRQKAALEKSIIEEEKQVDLITREMNWHIQFSSLKTNLAAANERYNHFLEEKKNASDREQKLKQVERLQPARGLVDGKLKTEKQLAEKISELKNMEGILSGLQKQKEELEKLLLAANEAVIAKKKIHEDAKPLMEEAKVLDVQINERTAQVKVAKDEIVAAVENLKKHEAQLKEKQQVSEQLLAGINALKQWKAENTARQPVAENHSLIVSKLDDAQKLLEQLLGHTADIESTKVTIETQTKEIEKLTASAIVINNKLQETQQLYDQLTAALSTVDFLALENEKKAIDMVIERMVLAEAHWKILFSKLNDYTALHQKLAANKKELDTKEVLLKEAKEKLDKMQIQQQTSFRMLEKARLVAAENVETLRLQLVPGDSCPVCGSKEHPFADHNPQLDHVLSELEIIHQKNELEYRECLQLQSSLAAACIQLKKTIDDQENEVVFNTTELEHLQSEWKKFEVSNECINEPDVQRADWIKDKILSKRALQHRINEKVVAYHHDKQQLDNLQQLIIKLDGQKNQNSHQLKDADSVLKSNLQQIEQHKKDLGKVNDELAATEKMLMPYFTATDWFNQWKKDASKFIERINAFAVKWKVDMQKLDEDSANYNILMETIKGMEEKSKTLQAELDRKEEFLSGLNAQLSDFNKKRKLIFNGEAVSIIEAGLQQEIETAQKAWEKHKGDSEILQISITRIDSQKEQNKKEISKLEVQLKDDNEKILQWLLVENGINETAMDEYQLVELLKLSSGWIETERAFFRAIDDSIADAQSVLNERRKSLESHEKLRTTERPPEELNLLLAASKEILKKSAENISQIRFKLDQDATNRKAIGALLETISSKALIVENWAKLNDIIGSADGKKFRQIAQEYTLDILLGYANVHLEILSKRYLLQRIPDTLGLQVLDKDMGNEIRTVFSLSGGESFLVSLALALGLASLSSSRMKVESLFIDEGFGSLDPATLNIAMDALERLQNLGRKVGVISHVQEMTERIPVQIKVSKEHSGRSKVEVIR